MDTLKRESNESVKDYKLRLFRNKEIYNLKTTEIAELINKETENNYNESTYRKWFKAYEEGYTDGTSNKISDEEAMKKLEDKKREIELETIKLRTEKIESNRWNREDARVDLYFDKIEEYLSKYRKEIIIPKHKIDVENNDIKLMNIQADYHFGVDFTVRDFEGNIVNEYNPEVFQKRMWILFDKIVSYCNKENVNNIVLSNLSDSIDGILRMSQLQSLKYGVIDSVMYFQDFMLDWINELSKYVFIDYYACWGNHNELRMLSGKKGTFPHENTERLMTRFLKRMLQNNPNVKINETIHGSYMVDMLGYNVVLSHGDKFKGLERTIKNYSVSPNKRIDYLVTGHLHSDNEKTIGMTSKNNIKYIQASSICGVDPYAYEDCQSFSKAGSSILLFEREHGKVGNYDIILN